MHFIKSYLDYRTKRGELSKETAVNYRSQLRYWIRYAGTKTSAWSEELALAWIANVGPSTKNSMISALRGYCKWLIAEGHLEEDPTKDIPRARVAQGAPRDLSHDAMQQLLRACPDSQVTLIVLLMRGCGLRSGDVARIQLQDLDPHHRTLDVRAKGGRGEVTHNVHVPSSVWKHVVKQINELHNRKPTATLIQSQRYKGRSLSSDRIGRLVRTAMETAGLKEFPHDGISPHALRHTCAQALLDNGADLRDVQFVLGHRSIQSTEIYTRRAPEGLRQVLEAAVEPLTDAA